MNAGFLSKIQRFVVDLCVAYLHFVGQRRMQSFYIGGRLMTECEVRYYEQQRILNANSSENLADQM